jgi:hypothetical protein
MTKIEFGEEGLMINRLCDRISIPALKLFTAIVQIEPLFPNASVVKITYDNHEGFCQLSELNKLIERNQIIEFNFN